MMIKQTVKRVQDYRPCQVKVAARVLLLNLLRPFLVLLAVGGVIGLFHGLDGYLAIFLAIIGLPIIWKMWGSSRLSGRMILVVGIGLTCFMGINAEIWGINNGYWVYHDLVIGRSFPLWLPAAWGLAFLFLYRVETRLIKLFCLTRFWQKMLLAAVVSLVLPTWGEIVTINLGVWTYSWGWQFLGVPLRAILLLMVLHMVTYLLLSLMCRAFAVDDLVFGRGGSGLCGAGREAPFSRENGSAW